MRKSGWTVATGLSSLVLLLTACGGSSSSSWPQGAASDSATQGTAVSSASTGSSSSTSSSTSSATSTANAKATQGRVLGSQADGRGPGPAPTRGSGCSLADRHDRPHRAALQPRLGDGQGRRLRGVHLRQGQQGRRAPGPAPDPARLGVGSVTGMPKAGSCGQLPRQLRRGLYRGSAASKVITYNGYPLYTYVGAPVLSTKGNGIGGVWHVIMLSESDVSGT